MNLAAPILQIIEKIKDTECLVGHFVNKQGDMFCPLAHYLIARGIIKKKVLINYANGKFNDETMALRNLLKDYKDKFDFDLFDDLLKLRGFTKKAPTEVIIEVLTKMTIDS